MNTLISDSSIVDEFKQNIPPWRANYSHTDIQELAELRIKNTDSPLFMTCIEIVYTPYNLGDGYGYLGFAAYENNQHFRLVHFTAYESIGNSKKPWEVLHDDSH